MKTEIIPLASGSRGNSTLIRTCSENILVDFGISTRRMLKALEKLGMSPDDISAILVTHEHGDHIGGLNTYTKHYRTPIYMPDILTEIDKPFIERADIRIFSYFHTFCIGKTGIVPFPVPHDSLANSGFRIETADAEIGYLTDAGEITDPILDYMEKTTKIVIESNYDEDMLRSCHYPWSVKMRIAGNGGHLSNNECREILEHAANPELTDVILCHLSEDANTPEIALGAMDGLPGRFLLAPILHHRI